MQIALVIAISLHVLSGVFWAGSSFTLARTGGAGAELLFRPQMGAAAIAVVTGGYLGHLLHAAAFGPSEQVLMVGIVAALIAAGVQGAVGGRAIRALHAGKVDETSARSRIATAQRIAAALLALTAICMGAARYV
jgi:uncharacterized membrane protein